MPKLIIVTRDGAEAAVEGTDGESVMQIIRDSGVDELLALCGGCRSCATCHVYVNTAQTLVLPDMSDDENELLSGSSHRQPNSRLSCQIRFDSELEGLRVMIAPEEL